MNDFNKLEEDLTEEELAKGPNYWKDKDPKKYKQMLNKLKRDRKTKGHKERAYQAVTQAKRRERGGKGTKAGKGGNGHSKGKMTQSTGSAVKNFQNSEKKSNEKLSPDRRDNSKGYGSGNVRNIPQRLNRGRHNADEKKVKAWKKKLKKYNITVDDFMTLLHSKALHKNDHRLSELLDLIDIEKFLIELTPDEV